MTKYVANNGAVITANGDYYICDMNKKRDLVEWKAGVIAYGTWASATVTYKISPDGGVTLVPYKDASGTTVDSTADDNFTASWGGGANNNDAPKFYITVSGATGSTSILVAVYDNNG